MAHISCETQPYRYIQPVLFSRRHVRSECGRLRLKSPLYQPIKLAGWLWASHSLTQINLVHRFVTRINQRGEWGRYMLLRDLWRQGGVKKKELNKWCIIAEEWRVIQQRDPRDARDARTVRGYCHQHRLFQRTFNEYSSSNCIVPTSSTSYLHPLIRPSVTRLNWSYGLSHTKLFGPS